jgi:hypothetical protein
MRRCAFRLSSFLAKRTHCQTQLQLPALSRPSVEQLEGVTGDRAAATVKADDAFAQFSLGVLYAVGAGLPADYAESAECYPFGSGSGFFT